ncbi:MAG: hypothetical protein ACTSPE_05135 [Candidatus Thorarchaeota archaeon]
MAEKILEDIRGLAKGGFVTGFVCARIPTGKLLSNWMQSNMVDHSLGDRIKQKGISKTFLVPADRVVRLVRDTGALTPHSRSLLLLGPPGIESRRFVVYVGPLTKSASEAHVVALWAHRFSPEASSAIFIPSKREHAEEPVLDYITQMERDVEAGLLDSALASQDEALSSVSTGATRDAGRIVLLHKGDTEDIEKVEFLFLRWISQLELVRGMRNAIAVFLQEHAGKTRLVVWDSPRGVVASSLSSKIPVPVLVQRYAVSVWFSSQDADRMGASARPSARPPAESQSRAMESLESDGVEMLQKRLDAINVERLLGMIENLEKRVAQLSPTYASEDTGVKAERDAFGQLVKRLGDLTSRLEELADRLERLEARAAQLVEGGGVDG